MSHHVDEPHRMTAPVGVALRHPYDVDEFYEVDHRSRPRPCRWPVGGHDAVEDGVDTVQNLLALACQLLSGEVGNVAVVILRGKVPGGFTPGTRWNLEPGIQRFCCVFPDIN